MQTVRWKYLRTVATGLTLALGLNGMTSAHDGHDHGGATHGGAEAKSPHYHFEAVFTKAGITLYAHGADHKAIDASRLTAAATFYHPGAPDKPWFRRELRAARANVGQVPTSLNLVMDLSMVPPAGATVEFQVTGLPDPAEPTTRFTVPVALSGAGEITVTKATQADQATINVQRLCKVSGEELGSMGVPLKVTRGTRSILICCQGCVKAIKADPDKYLGAQASAPAAPGEHDHKH